MKIGIVGSEGDYATRGGQLLVLIDADPIVYRCGFASEKTNWHLIYETPDGHVGEVEFAGDDKESAGSYLKGWLAANPHVTVIDKSKVIYPDPVSYALRAVNVQVQSIMEECEKRFGETGKMLMWISEGKSFRDKLATTRPYKGNRDPTHKPVHYGAIRDHLRAKYSSFVARGIEADDAVSIFAHDHYERSKPERIVIATIDKDLDQIPGWHYNYMQKVFYAITNAEAEQFFVQQCLSGDPTDNVIGCWKCGEAAARRIAERFVYPAHVVSRMGADGSEAARVSEDAVSPDSEYDTSASDDGTANAARATSAGSGGRVVNAQHSDDSTAVRNPVWWGRVVDEYRRSQSKPGCPYPSSDPEAIALEMAQLVHLQQYPGQLWHPHGDLVVPGFAEGEFDGQ